MVAPEEEIMVDVEIVHMEGHQVLHIIGVQVLIMAVLEVLLMIGIMVLHLHMRGTIALTMGGKGVLNMVVDTAGEAKF